MRAFLVKLDIESGSLPWFLFNPMLLATDGSPGSGWQMCSRLINPKMLRDSPVHGTAVADHAVVLSCSIPMLLEDHSSR